jgi:hypothetical protein
MDKHVVWGLLIPLLFLAFTGLARTLVRKAGLLSNFYLGIEMTLAAIATGITNIVVGAHVIENPQCSDVPLSWQIMFNTSIFFTTAVGCLLLILTLHQKFEVLPEEAGNSRMWRGILLGGVSNVLGTGLFAAFIYLKLGGQL